LFVQQSREYNASVFAAGGRFDVLVHSSLINNFSTDELCFVFGHELGHVVFGHTWFPVRDIWANIDRISPDVRNLLFRWARSSEVSADRIGLLCCGKLGPAVTALFKTSSGLAGIDVDRVLRSFRKQYQELEEHIRQPVSDSYTWIRSHPMIPIRFKALELASLDIIALRQQPKGFSQKGFRSVDRAIAGILESLDISVAPPQVISG
jgi:Zn-dependent protease with chaperone function